MKNTAFSERILTVPSSRRNSVKTVHFIFIAIVTLTVVFYVFSNEFTAFRYASVVSPVSSPNSFALSCYWQNDDDEDDVIESLNDDLVPINASIFFIETYCRPIKILDLNPRQSCSVESAARLNPNASVYVLVPATSRRLNLTRGMRALLSYDNVFIRHVNVTNYLNGTPLSNWNWEGHLSASRWPQSHVSDVLRFVTLWKFGGLYLDLDVVLLRPLNGTTNFAGAVTMSDIGSAVMSISRGHPLNDMTLDDLRRNFRGDEFPYNGPGVIKRNLQKLCGVEKTYQMNRSHCPNFQVFPPSTIYPVHWSHWQQFFTTDEKEANETWSQMNGSLCAHVWNYLSKTTKAVVGSHQPYVRIASEFCPKIYSTVDDVF